MMFLSQMFMTTMITIIIFLSAMIPSILSPWIQLLLLFLILHAFLKEYKHHAYKGFLIMETCSMILFILYWFNRHLMI